MKIEKIDIQSLNKKLATDIAMLVDKPEFLQEIKRLREKWNINKLYTVSNLDGFLTSKDVEDKHNEFLEDIDTLLKRFNRERNFRNVVQYALITGIVPDGVYRSCYFDVVPIGEVDNPDKSSGYQYVIVMSPRTELQEVKDVYKEFKEHIENKIDFHSVSEINSDIPENIELIEQFHKGNVYSSADISKYKTLKEIERTREWYWIAYSDKFNDKSNKRKSSEEILNEWQMLKCQAKTNHEDIDSKMMCPYCSVEDINIIDQALSAYSRLLNQS